MTFCKAGAGRRTGDSMTLESIVTFVAVVIAVVYVEVLIRKPSSGMSRTSARIAQSLLLASLLAAVVFDLPPSIPLLVIAVIGMIMLGVGVLGFAIFVGWTYIRGHATNRLFRQSSALVDQGRIEEAIELLKSRLGRRVFDEFILANLATLHVKQGQFEEAEDAINRAIAIAGDGPAFQNTKAALLMSRGEQDAALQLLQEATDRWPDDVPLWVTMSGALIELGEPDAAINAIGKAEEILDSDHPLGGIDPPSWRPHLKSLRERAENEMG